MADGEVQEDVENVEEEEEEAEDEEEEYDGEDPPGDTPEHFAIPYDVSGKEFYFCEICRKKFINYGSYRRHLRMHFCNKKYSCTICGRQFFRRYLWLKHQEKFHGDMLTSYDCPHCTMTLKTFDMLKEHLRTKHRRIHSMQELFSVPSSQESKRGALDDGDASETSETKPQQMYTCDVCDRQFHRRFQWLKHREQHGLHPLEPAEPIIQSNVSSPEPLTCGECGFECDTIAELEIHRKEDHRTLDTGTGTSRYGRRIKQRVLYNSDSFQGPKRARRSSKVAQANPTASPPPVSESQPVHHLSTETLRALVSAPSLISNPAITITPVTVSEAAAAPSVPPTDSTSITPVILSTPVSNKNSIQKSQRGTFFCEKCRRVFINKSSYLRHKKMHTGVKPFTCEFCCLSFFRSESLNTHKKKHADDPNDFRCYVCGYKAANSASLRNHYYTICSKDQKTNAESQQQQATTVPIMGASEKRDIAGFCAICNRAFFNQSNYQRHLQQHTTNPIPSEARGGSYQCTICSQWFTDYYLYDEHSRKAHPNNKGWENEAASNDIFSVPFDSRQEVKAENGMNGTIIMCKLCPMAFTTRSSYDLHVRTHAPSWLEFCNYCGNPFKNKKELVAHERTCYMVCTCEDRMYSCYQCGAYCESSSALKDHVLDTHVPSGDKVSSVVQKEDKTHNEDKVGVVETKKPTTIVELPPEVSSLSDDVEIVALNVDASPKMKEEPIAAKTSSSRLFKCGQCEETFPDMPAVFEHCRRVHEASSSSSSVPKSTIKTDSKIGSTAHVQNGPSSASSSGNSIMKQLLSSPPAFNVSNNNCNSGLPTQTHNCSLCLKSFTDKVAMERHEQLAHVMIDWYKCAICEKSGGQEAMERHMLTHMFKIGSMVTTSERVEVESPDGVPCNSEAPQFISVLCQICMKVFSSILMLSRHRHSETIPSTPSNNQPFICCMPNCGESFANTEDITKHLQNDHSASHLSVEKISKDNLPPGFTPWKPDAAYLSTWKPLSDVVPRRVRDDNSFPDIYQLTDEDNSGDAKDLEDDFDEYDDENDEDDADVEEIMIEPLLELSGDAKTRTSPDCSEGTGQQSPDDSQGADGEDDDSKPKPLLKCHECDSVFTNPCSWKRHRKLHLGIMKHKCPHCLRMFYRKDHCDKHIKTHTRTRKFRREIIFD